MKEKKVVRSQKQAVLEHLQKKGSITSKEAFEKYGATRLSAIIFDLKKLGYSIITEIEVGKTRYGNHSQYAKYSYKGEKK